MAATKLSNDRVIQLTTAMYLHREVASVGVRHTRSSRLNELVSRTRRHSDWYEKNQQVSSFFDYLEQLVRGWYPLPEQVG